MAVSYISTLSLYVASYMCILPMASYFLAMSCTMSDPNSGMERLKGNSCGAGSYAYRSTE